ncbi:MAG TPA: methyltransferase [Roseiflexaceae bacterium]|nr:methyltransferase [Roseiflexaceae bacterium]
MTLTPKLFRRQVVDAARAGEPAAPRCPHAPPLGMCGGCTFQDRSYAAQVAAKRAALQALWAHDLPAEMVEQVTMVASPEPFEYRTRMDYVASKDRFGLRRGGKFNYIIELDQCHLIPPAAFAIARGVYERAVALGLPDYNLRSHEGFLRYIVVRRSPQDTLLLAAVTAAPDEAGAYAAAMEQIAEHALAQPGVAGFHWLINDTLTDISFGAPLRHWGAELLDMRVGDKMLSIGPNTFFQNNVHLLLPLLDDVAAVTKDERPMTKVQTESSFVLGPSCLVVADLYGGVGTIALHLANRVGHVTCVESVEESARLAQRNVAANRVDNVGVVAADVLAFLRDQAVGQFDVVVADPPRAGLGPDVCRELLRLRPRRLVYVSCNALSQIEDARTLAGGYRLSELRGYDMFPQTPHMEALAVFERR